MIIRSTLNKDAVPILRSHRETRGIQHNRPRSRPLSGNWTTIATRKKIGILGDSIPDWISVIFFLVIWDVSSLVGKWISLQSTGGVDRYTCRTSHFQLVQSLHRSFSIGNTCAWLKDLERSSVSCVPKLGHSSTCHVSFCVSQYAEQQYKFSLTFLSYVTVFLSEPWSVFHASIDPLLRSTKGWDFYGAPLLHCIWVR